MRKSSGIWVVLAAGAFALILAFFDRMVSARSLVGVTHALSVMLAAVTVLWVHELGHAMGAVVGRLHVCGLNLWPYYVDLDNRKVHIVSLGSWLNGGAFRLKSRDGARSKLLLALLAGWVASLLLAAAAKWLGSDLELLAVTRDRSPGSEIPVASVLLASYLNYVSVFAVLHLVFEMLPLRGLSSSWDGAFVMDLLRGGSSEQRAVSHFIMNSAISHKRPREWDIELLDATREDANTMDRLNWVWWNYRHQLDKGDLAACELWVQRGIETWQAKLDLDANILRCERVYLAHRLQQVSFDYRKEFDDLGYSEHWWHSWHRARVVTCLREGNVKDALYYATHGRRYLNGHEESPAAISEVELWDSLVAECVAASARETAVASDA